MGRYFNPATKESIEQAGGRYIPRGLHSDMIAELAEGERLAWHLDRVMFKQVPDVTDPDEYREFGQQVAAGQIISLGFYAIPHDAFRD